MRNPNNLTPRPNSKQNLGRTRQQANYSQAISVLRLGYEPLRGVEEERSQDGESDDETSSVFRTMRKMLRPRCGS